MAKRIRLPELGKHLMGLARQLEKKREFAEAIRLARLAGKHGGGGRGLRENIARLEADLKKHERLNNRKAKYETRVKEAEAEQAKGPECDLKAALALWQEAYLFAPGRAEKEKAKKQVQALETEIAKREAEAEIDRRRAETRRKLRAALKGAKEAFDAGELDRAERLFRSALKLLPDNEEACEGLKRIARKRVEASYLKAMADGREAEEKGEWRAAKACYERALKFRPGDRAAETALEMVKGKVTALPLGFEGVFELPKGDKDQYGRAVVTRRGRRSDPTTGLPVEIWLTSPRMEFVLIPAGTFRMGSPKSEKGRVPDEGPVHAVKITQPFYVAKYEVTQAQWKAVMGNQPSHFSHAGDHAPVEQVSWLECTKFCRETGLVLPTEAQWEYACRAGAKTALYSGPLTILGEYNGPELDGVAWYGGNSGVRYKGGVDSSFWRAKQHPHKRAGTHPVGGKKPNGFGLYDTLGNVSEWCEDVYDKAFYKKRDAQKPDPVCYGGSGFRVIRGGGWYDQPGNVRCALRRRGRPGHSEYILGFRPVKKIP
jgi:formylglycine-generating enzyme required for sulfatase activity